MDESMLISSISSLGFPVIVSTYLLFQTSKQLNAISESQTILLQMLKEFQTEMRLNFELLRKERFNHVDLHKSGTQSER